MKSKNRTEKTEEKNSRKGVWCFMFGIVFFVAILGVANVMMGPETKELPQVEDILKKGMSNGFEWVKGHLKQKYVRKPLPASVVKAADPEKASEILNSIGNAAEIFSIRVGGGGDSLFPTNAVQLRDSLPPVVAKSLEGCFSDSVVPLGGYVCQYQADPARTDFLCKAIPANGYTGGVFVVRKDKTIRQVDDKVSNFTKSESRK